MQNIYVDREYRTGLSTAFYDRVAELDRLARLLEAYRLVIVYGPRGVGKSELTRYYVKRRLGGRRYVAVNARLLRARGLGESLEAAMPLGPVSEEAARALRRLLEGLDRRVGVVGLVVELWRLLARREGLVVFIDEFHELPGYTGPGYAAALEDLRSLAGLLSKESGGVRVVVTVSEGFAATRRAMAALEGYSTAWLLVEHLDPAHFRLLYQEYSGREGCQPSLAEIMALVGCTPGSLPDLCPLTSEEIVGERVPAWLGILEGALSAARSRLGLEPRSVIEKALEVLRRPVKPLREPEMFELGEALVEHNIAYPKTLPGAGIRYLPQYPVYLAALHVAAESGAESLLDLDPHEVYRRALQSAGQAPSASEAPRR